MADEVIRIQLELMGKDGVIRDLEKLNSLINDVTNTKGRVEVESNLKEAKKDVIAYTGEIEKLKREIKSVKGALRDAIASGDDDAIAKATEKLEELYEQLDRSKNALWDARQETREYNYTLKELDKQAGKTQKTFHEMFDSISRGANRVGGAMETLGNALQKIGMPFQRIMQGTIFAFGTKLLNLATSGLSGAAERYDVFATYEKSLVALGYGGEIQKKFVIGTREAMTALDNLEQSVLGLPTGLDEIVAKQKQYLAASGDVELATKAAIAANNLFLAQGSSARDQLRGERQLRNILAGGDMTSARWQTVLESMPMAVKAIGDQLGYTNEEFRKLLLNGDISQNDFLKAFLDVGTSGVISDAAEEMKHTFSAATGNVVNAFRRMGANVIKTFDEVFQKHLGKDTIDIINDIKKAIDRFSEGLQGWIRANPDIFLNLIETLKSFDIRGFFEGVGSGMKSTLRLYKMIMKILTVFGGKFGGFTATFAGPLGRFIGIVGGLIKGLRHPLALIGAAVGKLVQAGRGKGIIGKIIEAIAGNKGVATAAKEATTFSATMQGVFSRLANVLTFAGTVVIASGTGFIAFKSFKSMMSDLRDIIDILSTVDPGKAAEVLLGMTGFISAFAGLGTAISKAGVGLDILAGEAILGAITTFAAGIMALDMHLILSAATSFKKVLERISESIDIMGSIKSVNVNRSNLHNAIEALAEVYEELRPQYQGTGIQNMTKSQANSMAEILSNMTNVLKSLKEGVDIVADFSTIPDVSTSMDNIGTLVGIYDDVFDLLKPLGSWDNPKQATNMKDTTESLVGIMSSMLDSAAMINKLSQVRLNTTQLPDIISRFAEIRDLLFNQFTMTSGTTIVGGVAVQGGKSYKDQAKELSDISDLVSGIKNTIGYINDLWNILNGEGAITTSAEFKLKWITYANVVRELADWWQSAEISKDTFKGADKFASNLGNFTLAMGSLNDLITTLDEVKQKLGSRDVNIVETLAQFTPLISELNGISAALEGVNAVETESKVTLMNKALEGIKTLITTAEGIDGSAITDANGVLHGLADSLSNMGEELNTIATAWHEGFINALNFGGLSDEMSSGLDTVLKSLSKYETRFYSEGWKIGNKFRQGVMARVAYINASSTININARLGSVTGIGTLVNSVANTIRSALDNTAINVSPRINAPSRGYMHCGGKVQYRAGGGSIFPTRGSDTVPAMLTPNEFVMRNKAVDMFGLDFMRKVNDLNLTGAMQALQARMNSRFMNGRTQNVSTVNNVYNNQKVTQNVNTNNPNFAFKRSNRYVRALG